MCTVKMAESIGLRDAVQDVHFSDGPDEFIWRPCKGDFNGALQKNVGFATLKC
jgi:hypothetical protein